jgi:ketosteroid isomerase-like protein
MPVQTSAAEIVRRFYAALGDRDMGVQHATAEHGGKRLDITGCQLMTIEDGRITSVRGHYSDQYALDEFWS